MYKNTAALNFIALLFMPRLSEQERSSALGMLKADVRVFDVARYRYCHPSTIQRLRDHYQATGTVKDRRSFGQPRMVTGVKRQPTLCIDDIYFDDIRSGWLLSVQDEK